MKIPPNAIVIGAGALAVIGLMMFFSKQAAAAARALLDVNKGTPYEGAGVVGTLGNATNALSGGVLGDFGSWLGGKVYDVTHPQKVTLQSRKQAVQDNFWRTDSRVFTP